MMIANFNIFFIFSIYKNKANALFLHDVHFLLKKLNNFSNNNYFHYIIIMSSNIVFIPPIISSDENKYKRKIEDLIIANLKLEQDKKKIQTELEDKTHKLQKIENTNERIFKILLSKDSNKISEFIKTINNYEDLYDISQYYADQYDDADKKSEISRELFHKFSDLIDKESNNYEWHSSWHLNDEKSKKFDWIVKINKILHNEWNLI